MNKNHVLIINKATNIKIIVAYIMTNKYSNVIPKFIEIIIAKRLKTTRITVNYSYILFIDMKIHFLSEVNTFYSYILSNWNLPKYISLRNRIAFHYLS